jgi:mannose-6-phosphate isomerase-like protein (cupin superfamily)
MSIAFLVTALNALFLGVILVVVASTLVMEEQRPWGRFIILSDLPHTRVKILVVNPGKRLSYQSHSERDEHWVIVRGTAAVTLDGETRDYCYGEHVYVGRGVRHRISCVGDQPVEIIEVQTGASFSEEDIVRHEDDFGRATQASSPQP